MPQTSLSLPCRLIDDEEKLTFVYVLFFVRRWQSRWRSEVGGEEQRRPLQSKMYSAKNLQDDNPLHNFKFTANVYLMSYC